MVDGCCLEEYMLVYVCVWRLLYMEEDVLLEG